MINRKVRFFSISVGFSILIMMFFCAASVYSKTITVKQLGGGDYTTIGDAIYFSEQDDTIMVFPGRYEEAVIIDKSLKLIGSGPQVTEIYSPAVGVIVNASCNATIIGFTITSASYGNAVYPIAEGHKQEIVLFLGRLTIQKGAEFFLKAANKVLDMNQIYVLLSQEQEICFRSLFIKQ